jgi:thioredoxin reductase (NADPH)
VRGESLATSMSQYLIAQIEAQEKIALWIRSSVVEAKGSTSLDAITIADVVTGDVRTVPAYALFIFIGAMPHTDWVADVLKRDSQGFILTGPDLLRDGRGPRGWNLYRDPFLLETSVPGVFAAGDVRQRSVKRVASAVGEGSMAVQFVHQYLGRVPE